MLSSKGIKAGDAAAMSSYYEGLAAKDDYYTNGGEPPGRWIGQGAERMGLDGDVREGELRAAFHGYHPRTGEAIAARLGDAHKPGEDLTFSAPKSVSMIWAAGDAETQKAISEAQQRAVEAAIKHAEQSGAFRTQHGHAGLEKQAYTGGLAVATFEHSTSREGDQSKPMFKKYTISSEKIHLAQPFQRLPSTILSMRWPNCIQPVADQVQQIVERHTYKRGIRKIDVEAFNTMLQQEFTGSI